MTAAATSMMTTTVAGLSCSHHSGHSHNGSSPTAFVPPPR
jgi:hypothetical protein